MKITVLHGQSHKGSTYHLARFLCEQLGGEVTEFFLPRDFGAFCVGCTRCFTQSETLCPHARALAPITRALDEADVIILASPVYVYHVTGPMKALLDHYGWRWMIHRPQESMFTKQAVCLSTAAGAGTRQTNRDLAHSTFFWGVGRTHRYGVNVRSTSWQGVDPRRRERIRADLTALARKITRRVGKVRPGWRTKGFFHLVRRLQKGEWNQADRAYWQEKGWDGGVRPWR